MNSRILLNLGGAGKVARLLFRRRWYRWWRFRRVRLSLGSFKDILRFRFFPLSAVERKDLLEHISGSLHHRWKGYIVVHPPVGKPRKARRDQALHVHLFSAPCLTEFHLIPGEIVGDSTGNMRRCFGLSGQGFAIQDSQRRVLAEIYDPNNLYVLADIEIRSALGKGLLLRIIDGAIGRIQTTERSERPKVTAPLLEYLERFAEPYLSDDISSVERELSNASALLDSNSSAVQRRRNLVDRLGAELEALAMLSRQRYDRALSEFDAIAHLDKVSKLEVEGNVLRVFTECLRCVDPRSQAVHEIGEFEIEIFLDGSCGSVRWFNKTRKVDGYFDQMNAPYVGSDGQALIGMPQGVFPGLIGKGEVGTVVQLAIRFIEEVNTRDSIGIYIDRWPLSPD